MSGNFAFLSYSHKDKTWGDWLHAALEGYSVPRDLVGKQGSAGSIPKNLRPIFRDRVDMSAGDTVTATVSRQLAQSDALIVICSPNAAGSRYVNDEIRRFKASGRGKRIFPLIVGDPELRAEDCFPPSLKRVVNAQGHVTDEPDEPPLAADARRGKDGRDLAELKIIAGLIGVDLDVLRKREEIERRRRARRLTVVAAAMSVLAVIASALGVLSYLYKEKAETAQANAEARLDHAIETAYRFATRTSALAEQRGIPNDDVIELLRTAQGQLERLSDGLDPDSPGGARLGHTMAAMNIAFARSYRPLGQTALWWHLANTALDQMTELSARRSDDIELKRGLGRATMEVGETYRFDGNARRARELHLSARDAFDAVRAREGDTPQSLREVSRINYLLGEVERSNDNFEVARRLYDLAIEIGRKAVDATPDYADTLTELSEAIVGLGDTHNGLGQFAEAVAAYRSAAELREKLIAMDSRNIKARRLLSWALSAEGESLLELGRFSEAEPAMMRALEIRNQIYHRDETNTQSRRDIGWAHWSLAETLRLQGRLDAAEAAAAQAIDHFQAQLDASPDSTSHKRFVAKAHWLMGRVKLDRQSIHEAVGSHSTAVRLLRDVLGHDGASRTWQWDLAVALSDLGYAQFHAGAYERASACFADSVLLHARLIAGSPMPRSAHVRSRESLMERIAQFNARAGEVPASGNCE